jgi:D-alanyl-D-alanine carboxypeptidase
LSERKKNKRQPGMTARLAATILVALALWLPVGAHAGPALLFEANTEKVLYAEDPDLLWHPASLTKLMTAYLTFEAISKGELAMSDKITCSANANKQPPSKIGLPVGATMTVERALKVLIVKSANDVAVMIAEHVGGSEQGFIDQMNLAAKRLGMTRTNFVNPHGLPDKRQITTARDMALLTRAVLKEFPDYNDFFAMRSVKIGKRSLRSHNWMLRNYPGADGMKTGFICDSGYNVVASATRGDVRLVAVVMGARTGLSRRKRATKLLDHGFQRYEWKALFAEHLDQLPVQMASLSEGPESLRSTVCGVRRKVRRSRKSRKSRRSRKKR